MTDRDSAADPTAAQDDRARREAGASAVQQPDRFAWRARLRQHPTAFAVYRAGVAVVGFVIIVVGIVLLPLPGPGWAIIFVGIGVWATEFAWAKSLLVFARDKVRLWTQWMGRQNWFVRLLVGWSIVVLVAVCFWLVFLVKGVPAFLPGSVKHLLHRVPGL